MLFRITRNYDVVQEALMRAWKNVGRFEGRSQFSTWLTRIGIDEAFRGLRGSVEQSLELTDQVGERIPAWGARPEEVFESYEFLDAVDRALAELPLDYRTAVTLCDVDGLTTAEAAQILGIGERALKSRVHRGRMAATAAAWGIARAAGAPRDPRLHPRAIRAAACRGPPARCAASRHGARPRPPGGDHPAAAPARARSISQAAVISPT